MPLIQVGPNQYLDAAQAKQRGIQPYRPPAPVKRSTPPPPARPLSRPATARKARSPRPETVPQAMREGATNERIHHLIDCGLLEVERDFSAARWAGWTDAECREAQQRGLVPW